MPSNEKALPPLPAGAPGVPPQNRYKEQYGVILVCACEADQMKVYEALAAIKDCKIKVVVT